MSPEQIVSVVSVLNGLGKLPIVSLLIVTLVVPWIALLFFTWLNQRMIREFRDQFWEETKEARERFEVVVRMYENSAGLVKNYEKMCGDQQDLIISNTSTMQRLIDRMER